MISLDAVPGWLGPATAVVAFVAALVLVITRLAQLRREIVGLEEKIGIVFQSPLQVGLLESVLAVQRYRLAERSVAVEANAELIFQGHPAEPTTLGQVYLVGHVDLTNTGDRPVDVLACLVAGREVDNAQFSGLGREGREVGWDTLAAAPWNDPTSLIPGLSTTGNVFASRGQRLRLDPGETESLLRLDAVTNPRRLLECGRVNLLYKVFTVVLGHPVTLDATGRRVPETSDLLALLSQQEVQRWRSIQYSLQNLNRFPFRLALTDTGDPRAGDPLGTLANTTGWRCFLLHHWDFEQLLDKHPTGAPDPYGDERKARADAGVPWPTISARSVATSRTPSTPIVLSAHRRS
jgi:hypothetical protein